MSYLFRSATVISGDGSPPNVADVLISASTIAAIGPSLRTHDLVSSSTVVVDAQGLVLCPGFIDMHAHSDLYLLTHPEHEAKISQGVTTEVVGQDGISYYPIETDEQMSSVRGQIAGWNGNPSDEECESLHAGKDMFKWRTVGQYLDCLDRNHTAVNVAVLVPQGNLRLLACGPYDTAATPEQLDLQCRMLSEAMEQGAVGMSSGLTYTPGMYASTAELSVLCKHLATEFPGSFYAPHHRSYGKGCLGAYEEMLEIGKQTGVAVHLTHATMNFAENRGRAQEFLDLVDDSRRQGVDVSLDTYPYLPGSTTLVALLPSWASSGGPDETLQRLGDPELRDRMRVDIEIKGSDGGHGLPMDWTGIEIASVSEDSLKDCQGLTIAQIAEKKGTTTSEVVFDILRRDKLRTSILMHVGDEDNVRTIMKHETHCGGSDGILHGSRTHPRAWATFTRYIAHYARDLGIMSVHEMIAHLTSRPAKRLGIFPQRGLIAPGAIADIVVFDLKRIKDAATFDRPKQKSEGIDWVFVNGVPVIEKGKMTGQRPGRTLRRRPDGSVGS